MVILNLSDCKLDIIRHSTVSAPPRHVSALLSLRKKGDIQGRLGHVLHYA